MSLEVIYETKDKNAIFAITGGKTPITSFQEMKFTNKQLDECLPKEDRLECLRLKHYDNYGSLPLFSSLYSLSSDDEPLILYTAEGGDCDTCLEIFLKYGEGQRPNLDELLDMRTCMDEYNGDMKGVILKVEKLMEIMFPEHLYKFEHCYGFMGDPLGNFTWDRYQNRNYLPAGSPWSHYDMKVSHQIEIEQAYPNGRDKKKLKMLYYENRIMSLVASQPTDAYSEERVEYYRKQIKNGKRFGCIVYEISQISNYALILDGHHRVLACMLEGIIPDCLMISPAKYELVTINDQTYLQLPSFFDVKKRDYGIGDLSEEILEILRNETIVKKEISEEEKMKHYKYYRNDTRKSNFPKEYETAAKDMISKAEDMILKTQGQR